MQGIVTSFRVTGSRDDEAGLRYIRIRVRSQGGDYRVILKARLPQQATEAGDEVVIELDPNKTRRYDRYGLAGRIEIVKKKACRVVTVQATIAELSWPKEEWDLNEEESFGAKLHVRNPLVENPRERGAYISFVKGHAPSGLKFHRGSHVSLTGLLFPRHNGTVEMVLADEAVYLLPDKGPSNPIVVAAKRKLHIQSASENVDGLGVDYVRLLDASKRKILEREIGSEWPILLAKDATLLDAEIFDRWKPDFKVALGKACAEIKSGLTELESDLLACNVSAGAIEKIQAFYYPNEEDVNLTEFNDAMFMVRAGHLSFVEAQQLNNLGRFFCASIPNALGALWDYLRRELDNGNSAALLGEARLWMRMQDGFGDDEIDTAFALVGEHVAPAASLLGENSHRLVYVGERQNGLIAFEEIERIERRMLDQVIRRAAQIPFEVKPFEDTRLAKDADQAAAVKDGIDTFALYRNGRAGDWENLDYERGSYPTSFRN
jgi:hypothetical protein